MAQSLEVPGTVRELAARLGHSQPMRRGSLCERYVKCGKPGCACAEDPKAGHGPYYSLTRGVGRADPLPLPESRGCPTGARADRDGPAVSAAG